MAESGARTLGEFLNSRRKKKKPTRSRPGVGFYPSRAMYEVEFDRLWAAQSPHHARLTTAARDEIRDTLFFQRPLHPATLGKCDLDPDDDRFPATYLTGRVHPGEAIQAEALAVVFLCAGAAVWLNVSFLLAGVVAGMIVVNFATHHTRPFHEIENIEWPFMILFFVLAGVSLHVDRCSELGLIIGGILLLRTISRIVGGWAGARLSAAPEVYRRWMGAALLPQAGVAVGMALVAGNSFPQFREIILAVTIGTTVIFEIFGPFATMVALDKAGETGAADDSRGTAGDRGLSIYRFGQRAVAGVAFSPEHQHDVFVKPFDPIGIAVRRANVVFELGDRPGEFLGLVEAKRRVMFGFRRAHQFRQRRFPFESEKPDVLQGEVVQAIGPPLDLFQVADATGFVLVFGKVFSPDGASGLAVQARIDEEPAALAQGLADLVEEPRAVEMVDGVEGKRAVERAGGILELTGVDPVDGEIADAVGPEIALGFFPASPR